MSDGKTTLPRNVTAFSPCTSAAPAESSLQEAGGQIEEGRLATLRGDRGNARQGPKRELPVFPFLNSSPMSAVEAYKRSRQRIREGESDLATQKDGPNIELVVDKDFNRTNSSDANSCVNQFNNNPINNLNPCNALDSSTTGNSQKQNSILHIQKDCKECQLLINDYMVYSSNTHQQIAERRDLNAGYLTPVRVAIAEFLEKDVTVTPEYASRTSSIVEESRPNSRVDQSRPNSRIDTTMDISKTDITRTDITRTDVNFTNGVTRLDIYCEDVTTSDIEEKVDTYDDVSTIIGDDADVADFNDFDFDDSLENGGLGGVNNVRHNITDILDEMDISNSTSSRINIHQVTRLGVSNISDLTALDETTYSGRRQDVFDENAYSSRKDIFDETYSRKGINSTGRIDICDNRHRLRRSPCHDDLIRTDDVYKNNNPLNISAEDHIEKIEEHSIMEREHSVLERFKASYSSYMKDTNLESLNQNKLEDFVDHKPLVRFDVENMDGSLLDQPLEMDSLQRRGFVKSSLRDELGGFIR